MTPILPGQTYRHFKSGSIYTVIGIAHDSETLERRVIYRRVSTTDLWARPIKEWSERMPDGRQRFTLV